MTGGVAGALTQRVGPLPAWAWGLVAAGGIVGVRFVLSRRRGADDQAGDDADQTAADGQAVPDYAAAEGATRPGALFPTYDVRGAVSDPGASGSSADPNTRPAWVDDLIVSIGDGNQRVVDTIAAAPAPVIEVNLPPEPAPPAPAEPSPVVTAPVAAPPAPTTARPAPRPVPGPAKGTILWTGKEEPKAATINGLIRDRWPGGAVRWESRKRGGGLGYVAVVI